MRILDKYSLKRIVTGYIFILLALIGFYLFIDISSNISDMLKAKPPFSIIIIYYLNMLPMIFLTVSPYSLLISTLYTLGEFNKNNEILSMRASGISTFRIILPIIAFSLLVSFFSLYLQEKVLVSSQMRIGSIKVKFMKKSFSSKAEEKNVAFSSGNIVCFARTLSLKGKVLGGVVIFKTEIGRAHV